MPSVDNRVVRMEFDNAKFQAKIAQTLSSLEQLDKALKLQGASKGLSDVSAAANKVNLNPLAQGASAAGSAFSAMSAVAVTAIATVTHAAITSGARIAQSLSLEPVLDGFREFELNMGSIQTILANTKADGTNLQQVNDALDQLNEYSDKTIYNFGQMTKNIGTFTAAGVDLDTSVQAIKGISNLAAISGSTSEQASTAMYQLSQAISTGTLRLIDWNSVVNAGMGGEVFQKALFETGVAMGTITDAPVGTTFEEWTDAGNSFRDSLESGWLTSEVLTTTLQGFTGDMTEAQLLAIGYTKEQAAAILELGNTGVEAATKVRTLTQLMSTVKESIASGWAASFRAIIGDFEESTELFTGLSNTIGNFFKDQAARRNELLEGWAAFGGRDAIIQGLIRAFDALTDVIKPVREAFRDVFPALTVQRLLDMSNAFRDFTARLKPSEETLENIGQIFNGLFSILKIGWSVITNTARFIKDLVVELTGLGNGNILQFLGNIGQFFTDLRTRLRDGEAITDFFDNLTKAIQPAIEWLQDARKAVFDFFDSLDFTKADEAGESTGRLGQRFEQLSNAAEGIGGIWENFKDFAEKVIDVLETLGGYIGDWFSELGQNIADAMGPGDFDAVLDAFNVSLLGGIALLISKFLSGGINLDFGGGVFSNISNAFEELTGVLEAMQTEIRADALLKIAGAVGILTASVVALSLIDSGALTRALTAMAVGFGQLMATFAVINAANAGLLDGATFVAVATGMVILAGAILILSAAVAIMSRLGWEELAKGLSAITLMLTVLSGAAIVLSKNTGSLIAAAIGIGIMAASLTILAGAVKLFSLFDWDDMAKGFAGVAAGLLIMAGAAHLMPPGLVLQGAGLLLIATSLVILAEAVKSFSDMEWDEMAKGMVGIAGALLIIAGAMQLFPPTTLLIAPGLIAVGIALRIIAEAMEEFADMDWGEIGKGLVAMAGALLILALAANAMSGALVGAASIAIVSASMLLLAEALTVLGEIKAGDLAKALLGLTAALLVFIAAAGLITFFGLAPALLALGAAMTLAGAGFALFGVGAYLVAEALQTLADIGPDAANTITESLEAIGGALPALMRGFAEGVVELIQVFADAAPVIAEAIGELLSHILDTFNELLPKVGDLIAGLVDVIVQVVTESSPQLIAAGLELIINLLRGIQQNIGEITTIVALIIVTFLNALTGRVGQIITAGTNLLVTFLEGIAAAIPQVAGAVSGIMTAFLLSLAAHVQAVIDTGFLILTMFLKGITDNINLVILTIAQVIVTMINTVSSAAVSIANAGTNALVNFLLGITNNLNKIITTVSTVITTFINSVSGNALRIIASGANAIINFISGLGHHALRVAQAGVSVTLTFLKGISSQALVLAVTAADIVIDFLNALAAVIRDKGPELRQAGINIAVAIADGISGGLASKASSLAGQVRDLAGNVVGAFNDALGIFSPSKVFYESGVNIGEGLELGIRRGAPGPIRQSQNLAESIVAKFQKTLVRLADEVQIPELSSPVITPVLDLTQFEDGVNRMDAFWVRSQTFTPTVGVNASQAIARQPNPVTTSGDVEAGGRGGVSFEQNIYAPTELSTATIYRQTRNQITMAKEELDV